MLYVQLVHMHVMMTAMLTMLIRVKSVDVNDDDDNDNVNHGARDQNIMLIMIMRGNASSPAITADMLSFESCSACCLASCLP